MDSPRVVLANGCFDLLHIGHLLYLEAAARMGDRLVVAVTQDKFVNKGPGRPMFNETHRLSLIKALRCVDDALLVNGALEALETIKPDIFVKGADYIDKIEKRHSDYCKANGIEIRFTSEPIFSTTQIINDRLRQG